MLSHVFVAKENDREQSTVLFGDGVFCPHEVSSVRDAEIQMEHLRVETLQDSSFEDSTVEVLPTNDM
jgi:hypothetical protein